jgi:hypothetical protein
MMSTQPAYLPGSRGRNNRTRARPFAGSANFFDTSERAAMLADA